MFGLCLLTSISAYGLQTLHLKVNESGTAKISAFELSRIFVDGDRIQSVRGIDNTYVFKSDRITGEVFLKPTPEYQQKPFTVHLTTEGGRTFSLLLIPFGTPAQNIMIKPQGVKKKQAEKWEVSLPYEKTLTNLIIAMFNGSEPEGFDVENISEAKKSYLGDVATLQLQTVYIGERLKGEIYVITNRKKIPITRTESEFYRVGTRAIALSENVIPGQKSTFLYVITNNQN